MPSHKIESPQIIRRDHRKIYKNMPEQKPMTGGEKEPSMAEPLGKKTGGKTRKDLKMSVGVESLQREL